MSTLLDLQQKWEAKRAEWARLGVSVNGERVAAEILNDVQSVAAEHADQLLTPTQAAALTNYHPESIARLVRTGRVPNHGTKHRPRLRLADLPKKAAGPIAKAPQSSASSDVVSIDSIARDAIAGRLGRG